MSLSLVIPCYNEEGNIPLIFARLRSVLGARKDIEVLLVNNGSTDRSADILTAEIQRTNDARLRSVNVPVNQGYGFGILQGARGSAR